MATRKPFATTVATPAIAAPPSSASNGLAAELENFGQDMMRVSGQLIESHVRQEEVKAGTLGLQEGQSGTFAPRRDATRAAEAYNRAGFETYFDNLKISAGDEIDRIFNENQADPDKLESALAGYREGTESNLNKSMPELISPFRSYFDRASRPYRRQSADLFRQTQTEQRVANANTFLSTKERQDERLAFLADSSVDAVADLSLARNEYLEGLLRLGPIEGFALNGQEYAADGSRAGALDPAKLQKAVENYDRMIVGARVKGEFKRAQKAGRGERFVMAFANDHSWLKRVSLDERDQLTGWMRGEINDARALREASDKTLTASVEAAVHTLGRGEIPGGLDDLRARVRGTDLETPLRLAVGNQDMLEQFRRMPPPLQAATLKAEREAMKGVTPTSSGKNYADETASRTARIIAMEQTQKATVAALDKDAYGFAAQVGATPPPPQLLDPDGSINETGAAVRATEAYRLSALYGRQVLPMSDGEIDALGAAQVTADPVTRAARTGDIVTRFRTDQALGILQAMDKKGYVVDAAAGGMVLDGAPEVAEMIYQGDAVLNPIVEGVKPAVTLKDADFDAEYLDKIGNAMALNPQARVAAREAVKRVYASMAIRRNKPLDTIDPDIVDEAVTAVFGGPLIKFHGVKVTPPVRGATEDTFEGWWDSIDAKAIKAAGGLAGYDDEAAAKLIRDDGVPVEIRQGEYKIVIPDGGELNLTKVARGSKGGALVLRFGQEQ